MTTKTNNNLEADDDDVKIERGHLPDEFLDALCEYVDCRPGGVNICNFMRKSYDVIRKEEMATNIRPNKL